MPARAGRREYDIRRLIPRFDHLKWKMAAAGIVIGLVSGLLIVTNMLEDLSKAAEGGRVAADRDPESIDRLLESRGVKPIDFAGWKKIDAFERAEGAKEGREHKKVIDPEQMRALAHA